MYPQDYPNPPTITNSISEKSCTLEGFIIVLLRVSVVRLTDKQWTALNLNQKMEAFTKQWFFKIAVPEAVSQRCYIFIEFTLRHGCSSVNFWHNFGTLFYKNTSGWLLPVFLNPHILSLWKRASIVEFTSKVSAAKAVAKGPQLYPSVCFWTGKKLTMNSFTQFLYNAWTHFLFIWLRDELSNYQNQNPSIATKSK